MAYQKIAKTITIRNTSNQPILIDIKTRKRDSIFYTDKGIIKILPGRFFEIEENRIDAGLIENYTQSGQIQTSKNQVVLDDTEPPETLPLLKPPSPLFN